MKNVLFLVIDSLSEIRLKEHFCNESLMPFIDSKLSNCIYYDNFYSQGPYTEAGTKSLFCGCNTMDSYGYLLRFARNKNFITDVFKNEGYETININYPTCLFSNKTVNSLDKYYFNAEFLYQVIYDQKILYYIDLYNKNQLDKNDFNDLIELYDMVFEIWIRFLKAIEDDTDEISLIKEFIDKENAKFNFSVVSEEFKKFLTDKNAYILNILKLKENHVLNSLKSVIIDNYNNKKLVNDVWISKNDELEFLKKSHNGYNFKNNHIDRYFLQRLFIKFRQKRFDRYLVGEIPNLLHHNKKGKEITKLYNSNINYTNMVSTNKQLSSLPPLLKGQNKFILCHIEEPHNICSFFSYDTDNQNLLKDEIDYAYNYSKNLNSKYKGLLAYDLAVRYVDKCLKNLFKELENNGSLENTTIVLTGDHGTSYNTLPPRDRNVINFYAENYKVPFIIFDKDIKENKTISRLTSNSKAIPILMDFLKLNYKKYGFDLTTNDTISIEFMGSGCPDIRRRPVWLSIRNNNYVINYISKLSTPFDEKKILSIFDCTKDPMETKNICYKRNEEIKKMIIVLKNRYIELQNQYSEILL